MQKTDAELIAEVEGLDAKASPGPWTNYDGDQGPSDGGYIWREDPETRTERVLGAEYGYSLDVESGDWQFILKARTLLPELARRLKAANAERDEFREKYYETLDARTAAREAEYLNRDPKPS